MNSKAQIKIIKKNAVKFYKTTTVTKESPKKTETREIASTVSGWVNEYQLRSKEVSQTFDYLFAQN